ncbi:hypothetical protein, partial [Candidatus Magnetaquicoccus inordinatus]|uniref:hypothetical protein n=1 Tax=Candidatus Magnetaquicoccus inordinatus TaxID=2496818 RepID=UPI00102C2DCF
MTIDRLCVVLGHPVQQLSGRAGKMNTGEFQMVFCAGGDAHVAGKPMTENPYSRNGSGAWLAWQAGWLTADNPCLTCYKIFQAISVYCDAIFSQVA